MKFPYSKDVLGKKILSGRLKFLLENIFSMFCISRNLCNLICFFFSLDVMKPFSTRHVFLQLSLLHSSYHFFNNKIFYTNLFLILLHGNNFIIFFENLIMIRVTDLMLVKKYLNFFNFNKHLYITISNFHIFLQYSN